MLKSKSREVSTKGKSRKTKRNRIDFSKTKATKLETRKWTKLKNTLERH